MFTSAFYDAFFVQGFNAARDRLWQIDLWRRRGLGQLAEVFGPSYLEQDRAARLFLYRGDMYPEWLAYGSDTKQVATAFVEGINQYISLTEQSPDLLPPEFKMIGYKPALWAPEDVVRIRSHGLVRNVRSEVVRARIMRDFGPQVEAVRNRLEPAWTYGVPDGTDVGIIPENVLRVYDLATAGVVFREGLALLGAANDDLALLVEQLREAASFGSNNWAVAPHRTDTGRPILANDPHRAQSVPSLRYIAHLVAPGLDVVGAGEPALPGISIGHNGQVAFGLTIFAIDQEDLYFYETNPTNPSEYYYNGRWEPMEVETQTIAVAGQEPQVVELKFTRHGPVVYEDPTRRLAFAVRAAWLEPGMAPYLGSMDYMRARNWDEFLSAMNRWGAPSENQVYADMDGNIGWKPGGRAPIRPNWDGLLPVPGDGRYEWAGFHDMDLLPAEFNPERGWVATANEMNLPRDYPYEERKLGFDSWATPFRIQRITEALSETPRATLDEMLRLQTDYLSIPARRVVRQLGNLTSDDPKVAAALDLLRDWDFVLSADSAPAALFEVWYNLFLRQAVVARLVPAEARAAVGAGDPVVVLDLVESPDDRLGPDSVAARDEILLTSLSQAVARVEELLGLDMGAWAWGRLHHAMLEHPLSPIVDEAMRARLNVGPLPRGGSGDTVGNTSYRTSDFRQTGGSSWRMVIDVGNWDNTLAMSNPGQSGNPDSPHYADLFPRWARDEAFVLPYSREKIEAVTEQRIVLTPTGQ
jgi:penicillin amidase